jgi:hypothetical protein
MVPILTVVPETAAALSAASNVKVALEEFASSTSMFTGNDRAVVPPAPVAEPDVLPVLFCVTPEVMLDVP